MPRLWRSKDGSKPRSVSSTQERQSLLSGRQKGPERSSSFSTPRPVRFIKYHGDAAGEFGFFVTVAFAVNFVMGAGFLGVPKAFYESGYILGPALLLFCASVCDYTKNMVLEAMARAEAVTEFRLTDAGALTVGAGGTQSAAPAPPAATEANAKYQRLASSGLAQGGASLDGSTNGLGASGNAPTTTVAVRSREAVVSVAGVTVTPRTQVRVRNAWRPRYRITARKFEATELCELFLGRPGKLMYTLCVVLFNGGALWAFTSVFATSFSAYIPLWFLNNGEVCDPETTPAACWASFHVWLGLFAVIVVPLSMLELREQRVMQIIMFVGRILIVTLLCVTALVARGCDGVAFVGFDTPGSAPRGTFEAAKFSGAQEVIAISVYALIMHQSLPVLTESAKARGPRLATNFFAAFATVALFYTGIGLMIASYFGAQSKSQCNLHWEGYVGCIANPPAGAPPVSRGDAPAWASALRSVVLLFPALDVLTAYPLNAIVLGNNLLSAYAGDVTPSMEQSRLVKHGFRLLAAVLPIVGAFLVSDLDRILSVTGVVGFGVAFFFPAILSAKSATMCVQVFGEQKAGPGPARTPYRHRWYFKGSEYVVAAVFAIIAVYTLVYSVAAATGTHL